LPFRYVDYLDGPNGQLAATAIRSLGSRFAFLHAYDAIAEPEEPIFRDRGQRVIAPLPDELFASSGSWRGSEAFILFHCGSILDSLYYFEQYKFLKSSFGDLPHKVFGPQESRTNDPHVLPWMSEAGLRDVFARGRVFAYTSREPRHLHFTPLEAMAIGMPVVYFNDSLLAQIVEGDDPGACASVAEMHEKLARLVGGDMKLAEMIARRQHEVPAQFRQRVARDEWREVFKTFGLPTDRT
jgi:glycosyltransferase involved in cell wall biosynthesis